MVFPSFSAFGGALSFCAENPIDQVVNQMEQTFPLKIFRGKKITFRGIPGRFPFVWKNRGELSVSRSRTNFLNQDIERDECVPFETFFSFFVKRLDSNHLE